MKTSLPDVTLVIIDSVATKLTVQAISDTLNQITPNETVWFSSPKINSLQAVSNIIWHEIGSRLKTSHALFIQYDGWVLDGARWKPEFLKYDYIGAPWPWHKGFQVGNGGFSLRSQNLLKYLSNHSAQFPPKVPEDDFLCRQYRPQLESAGFKFAPIEIASNFSFERETPRPTFGFHGIFNWPKILTSTELIFRKSLANNYVKSKVEWKEI